MSKVTLKIGDKFSSAILFENLVITEFVDSKIYMSDGKYWNIPLRQDFYYVNGGRYAKEDIIVPTGEEFEPITQANIVEVLEHNGISQDFYSLGKDWISHRWTSTNSCMVWSITLSFDNPKWLEHLEVEFGKLKPLPKKANPFDVVKVEQWVKCIKNTGSYADSYNKWVQRVDSSCGGFPRAEKLIWFKAPEEKAEEATHSWDKDSLDLTDIRDYNPDEEIVLKAGDKYTNDSGYTHTIKRFDYIRRMVITNGLGYRNFDDFNKENGVISVNGRQGKYVIPPFDFVQTLLDNGFNATEIEDSIFMGSKTRIPLPVLCVRAGRVFIGQSAIKPTPENAKRIIDVAEILKDLEI